MAENASTDFRSRLAGALEHDDVRAASERMLNAEVHSLVDILELARAFSAACGADAVAARLEAELSGYQGSGLEVPEERKALGFASPFRVRALDMGFLDPEEVFLANREKFSQVTLTIGQPMKELLVAMEQTEEGGVLALTVPASEVTEKSADTDDETEVFIYILPREIEKIIESAKAFALHAFAGCVVEAALGRAYRLDRPEAAGDDASEGGARK